MTPSLDQVANGAALDGLSRFELAALLASCAVVQSRIAAMLVARSESAPVSIAPDKLLDAKEAAAWLGVSPTWLYRRVPKLPFAVRLGSRVRFSERKLSRYLANRSGVEAESAR